MPLDPFAPCDDCQRCPCGANYCPNIDGPACPWCLNDPEIDL